MKCAQEAPQEQQEQRHQQEQELQCSWHGILHGGGNGGDDSVDIWVNSIMAIHYTHIKKIPPDMSMYNMENGALSGGRACE